MNFPKMADLAHCISEGDKEVKKSDSKVYAATSLQMSTLKNEAGSTHPPCVLY